MPRLLGADPIRTSDICTSERVVFAALAEGPKTIFEIEGWTPVRGHDKRRRQQTICRCLHRLIDYGVVEQTSRTRISPQSGWPCKIYRLTRFGEVLWHSD